MSFSDLALHEERQLYTLDKYFQDEEAEPSYQMAGKEITPKLLLEAIRALPEERRKIVLLYYFEGLTDIEIAKQRYFHAPFLNYGGFDFQSRRFFLRDDP